MRPRSWRRSRGAIPVVAAFVLGSFGPGLGSSSAMDLAPVRIAGGSSLPFTGGIEEILVLDERGLVFISGGEGEPSVAVVDLTGAPIGELPIPDSFGMATDGDVVFVASRSQGLVRVDATTMPPTLHPDGPIDIAPYSEPSWVRRIGSSLWVSGRSGDSPAIFVVGTDGTDLRTGVTSWGGRLETDDAGTDLLVYGSVDVARFDAGSVPAQYRWERYYPGGANAINDLAVVPGSTRWIVAASSPYDLPELRMGDGERVRSYDGHAYPSAVDVSEGHGGVVAGATSAGSVGTDVWVYAYGRPAPLVEFELTSRDGVVPSGLAWSSDASRLFVVLGDATSDLSPQIVTLYPFARQSRLQVSASPAAIDHGSQTRVGVELTGGRTNRVVGLYEQPAGGDRVLIRRVDMGDDGVFTVRVEPRVNTRYVAVYEGEPRWSPDESFVRVGVRVRLTARLDGYVATDGRYRIYRVGGTMRMPLRVVPNHGGQRVSAELQASDGGPWAHVGGNQLTLTDDSRGLFFMDDVPAGLLFRIRTWMRSHDDHLRDDAGWYYFRARSGTSREVVNAPRRPLDRVRLSAA